MTAALAELPSELMTDECRQLLLPQIAEELLKKPPGPPIDLDNGVEEMEDELDRIAMAEQSSDTYRTINQAYAGSSMLTMNTLLHRNYRAWGKISNPNPMAKVRETR